MDSSNLSHWLREWPRVRAGVKALIEERARRDPNFYRRYAELEMEEVDRALARLEKMAKRMLPKAD